MIIIKCNKKKSSECENIPNFFLFTNCSITTYFIIKITDYDEWGDYTKEQPITSQWEEVKTIFIEELFYDNISVQGISLSGNKEYVKQIANLCEIEKYLKECLKGKYLKAFLKFNETWNFINSEMNKMYFIEGFKMGSQCTYESFFSDNKSN